ncbi:MAG TPA: zinc metallopeptidase [Opitutaceae bacterium]|nr:zinc metallopeptidase [Opitutaceae bacterium]
MITFLAFAFIPSWMIMLMLLLTMVFAIYAQYRVHGAYNKNSQILSRGRITGREAAEAVMQKAGITDVEIVEIPGQLTDHYDPINKRLALSESNYNSTSLAAVGVAAHEAGHAIQHKVGYQMLHARMALIPVTQIASNIIPIIMIAGFFFGRLGGVMLDIGILCYFVLTIFQLITLPVEFDASRRAKIELAGLGIVDSDEAPGVAETLDAAALTYVAAFLGALLNLLYLISMRRDD